MGVVGWGRLFSGGDQGRDDAKIGCTRLGIVRLMNQAPGKFQVDLRFFHTSSTEYRALKIMKSRALDTVTSP